MPSSMPAATRALLILNIAVFGAQLFADDLLVRWFALWPPASLEYPGAPAFEIWQLVTGRLDDAELVGVAESDDMPHGNPQ